jgi:hypothetical protein
MRPEAMPLLKHTDMIERSRRRGIEVVAAVAVPAASSSVAGAHGMNRLVRISDDGDQHTISNIQER